MYANTTGTVFLQNANISLVSFDDHLIDQRCQIPFRFGLFVSHHERQKLNCLENRFVFK